MSDEVTVLIDFSKGLDLYVTAPYVNDLGEVENRRFMPRRYFIGKTDDNPEPRMLIEVYDMDTCTRRVLSVQGFIEAIKRKELES